MDLSDFEARAAGLLSRFDPESSRKALLARPFIIELTGTPKSGKSTTKTKLEQFFRRNGYAIEAPEEGAEAVTWAKRPPEYNLQTGEYALSRARALALGPEHKSFHVVIFDRALYDVVIRMEFWRRTKKITAAQQKAIEKYYLLDMNRQLFDCHIVMVADAQVALHRELNSSMSKKQGETMNNEALAQLYLAHQAVWKRLECASDPKMNWRNTAYESEEQTAAGVLTTVLDAFNRRLDATTK